MGVRIVFAGTPQAAVPTLEALQASRHDIALVVTRPPARTGRGRKFQPSPVAAKAEELGLPVLETSTVKTPEVAEAISQANPDLGVIVAYGGIIPPSVLEIPEKGWINLHFSDLPRWRGAAPVQWSIREGDSHTAACVFQLEAGLDTGPVYSRLPVPITTQNVGELLEEMAILGGPQVVQVCDDLETGDAVAVPQDSVGITVARQLQHEDGFIDFSVSAVETDRIIRSVTPNPGAWTVLPDGQRMKIARVTVTDIDSPGVGIVTATKKTLFVGCSDVNIQLEEVAPAGKGWMDGAAWARGARLADGFTMGQATQ